MKALLVPALLAAVGIGVLVFLQPWLYRIAVLTYGLVIRCSALVNPKARAWVKGRKDLHNSIRLAAPPEGKTCVWFHCASLGEFEQGRPVIEGIRKAYPDAHLVLTFFSPSGYAVRKDYPEVQAVLYLPLDTPANANFFLDTIRPDLAVFVKYEFWYFYLSGLRTRKIPALLISAAFRKKQLFFRWFGRLHRTMLRSFTQVFVQNEASLQLMHKYGYTNGVLAFDTRFDRVQAIADQHHSIPEIETFTKGFNVLVAGSTWPHDERLLSHAMYHSLVYVNFKLILAPHHIDARSMRRTLRKFSKYSVRWSEIKTLSEEQLITKRILIMDNMGMLAYLYRYGDVNYVGGGFDGGVHNTLEAAVYGKPVMFGPKYKQFQEARDLVQENAALDITSEDDLINRINLMNQFPFVRTGGGSNAAKYVREHTGGTSTILQAINGILRS